MAVSTDCVLGRCCHSICCHQWQVDVLHSATASGRYRIWHLPRYLPWTLPTVFIGYIVNLHMLGIPHFASDYTFKVQKQTCFIVMAYAIPRLPAGMWYHLSTFYTDKEIGVAYSYVSAGTALSQVCTTLHDSKQECLQGVLCVCHAWPHAVASHASRACQLLLGPWQACRA